MYSLMGARSAALRNAILAVALIAQIAAHADILPERLGIADAEGLDAERSAIGRPFPGLIAVPNADGGTTDARYGQLFHAACYAYAVERKYSGAAAEYERRFIVHVPVAEAMQLARRVARLLLLFQGEMRARLNYQPMAANSTVNVWLMDRPGLQSDSGGEQIGNNIYLYDIYEERKLIEWVREIAHEYGHLALPGVCGFTEPEAWANGVLGERLFLKWLDDDLRSAKIKPADIAFGSRVDVEEYNARQVSPLIGRIARDGLNARLMARRDAAGMDYYTAFVLYLDSVYGSPLLLDAMRATAPRNSFARTSDFVRGALSSLADASELRIAAPLPAENGVGGGFFVYLPQGDYIVSSSRSVRNWRIVSTDRGVRMRGEAEVVVRSAGWRRLYLSMAGTSGSTPYLVFRKRVFHRV